MIDTSNDPEVIDSKQSGFITRDGIVIVLCIHRLEYTKWTLQLSMPIAPRQFGMMNSILTTTHSRS